MVEPVPMRSLRLHRETKIVQYAAHYVPLEGSMAPVYCLSLGNSCNYKSGSVRAHTVYIPGQKKWTKSKIALIKVQIWFLWRIFSVTLNTT